MPPKSEIFNFFFAFFITLYFLTMNARTLRYMVKSYGQPSSFQKCQYLCKKFALMIKYGSIHEVLSSYPFSSFTCNFMNELKKKGPTEEFFFLEIKIFLSFLGSLNTNLQSESQNSHPFILGRQRVKC